MIDLVRPTGLISSMAECYTGGMCIDPDLDYPKINFERYWFQWEHQIKLVKINAINFEPCLKLSAYIIVERWPATTMLLAQDRCLKK